MTKYLDTVFDVCRLRCVAVEMNQYYIAVRIISSYILISLMPSLENIHTLENIIHNMQLHCLNCRSWSVSSVYAASST